MKKGPSDPAILAARTLLQKHWTDTLTTDERSAWQEHWTTNPPRDIAGRTYVPWTPTLMSQIRVTLPTAYAWSQMFGTFYFGTAPVNSPTNITSVGLSLEIIWAVGMLILVRITAAAGTLTNQKILVYTSSPYALPKKTPDYFVRMDRNYFPVTIPAEINAFPPPRSYLKAVDGYQVAVTAAIVNNNNEIDPCPHPTIGTLADRA